jgi:hypothetical protein
MVDSCLKVFKLKCFRKSSINTLRDSHDSIFQNDKNANIFHDDKKLNFTTCATPIDKKVATDNGIDGLELEANVVLRRHNRTYLRSISTTTGNDVITSDDEDDDDSEILDVLFPLPRSRTSSVNTHERPLIEDANNRPNVDDKNGKVDLFVLSSIRSAHSLLKIFFCLVTDENNPKIHALLDYKSDAIGVKVRHEPNLLTKLLRKKYKRQVNFSFSFVVESFLCFFRYFRFFRLKHI